MEEKDVKISGEETGVGVDINSDENLAGTTHLNETIDEQAETEKLKAELEEQKDKYLRLFAEFDNFRKRNAKERLELIQTAGKDVIVSLLDVMDDCDRAEKQLQQAGETGQAYEGVLLVFNKLRGAMQAKGLTEMDSRGQEFDVEKHEAITEIPAPSEDMKGKVVDEIQKGYYLNNKIIRFAKVVVGN